MSETFNPDPEAFEDPLSNYEPTEYPSELHRVLSEGSVSEIELRPFLQVSSSTTIRDAIQSMHGYDVASLLVVTNGKVVGIFTERDVLEKVAEQYDKLACHPVSEVMTTDPTVIYETDTAATAVAAFAIAGHRHVPVITPSGTPAGVVSPLRVIRYFERFTADTLEKPP